MRSRRPVGGFRSIQMFRSFILLMAPPCLGIQLYRAMNNASDSPLALHNTRRAPSRFFPSSKVGLRYSILHQLCVNLVDLFPVSSVIFGIRLRKASTDRSLARSPSNVAGLAAELPQLRTCIGIAVSSALVIKSIWSNPKATGIERRNLLDNSSTMLRVAS